MGDGGKDTINYLSVLDGNDTVNGFDATSGGQDVLNMAALFDNYGTLSGTRESHISVTASGNNTVVNVDTDNNTSTWEMSITLTNVAVANITIGTDIIVV